MYSREIILKISNKTGNDSKNGKPKETISRRRFIRDISAGAAGMALATSFPGLVNTANSGSKDLSKVVIARHPDSVLGLYSFDQSIVGEMVNRAIVEFTGQEAPGLAWGQIFPGLTASDTIGIKINARYSNIPSHVEVTNALVEGLASIQVGGGNFPRNNIIIWDRRNDEISASGYTIYTGSDPDTARCFGTNQSGYGYDSGSSINVGGTTCNPSSILTDHCNYLINLPVLKNHTYGGAGVTLGMKNHQGTHHTPQSLHGCDPDIAELNQEIRDNLGDKDKITIIDSLVGVATGGPAGPPQFIYGGIILGTDTVATDYVGRAVLDDNGCNTIGIATHIETADTTYNLGTSDPAEMDVVEQDPIALATREYVDKMIAFNKEGLATELQVQWAVDRYDRGL